MLFFSFDYLVIGEDELMYNYVQLSDGYEIVYEEELKINRKNKSKYRIFKKITINE